MYYYGTPGTLQTSGFLGTRYETVEKVGPAIAGQACKHKFEVGGGRIGARVPVGYRIGTGSVPVLGHSSRILDSRYRRPYFKIRPVCPVSVRRAKESKFRNCRRDRDLLRLNFKNRISPT